MIVALALAADPDALRRGLEDPAGWAEIDRKQVDDVGEIVVRHKEVLGESCLEGSTTVALDADALLAAATAVEDQPRWSSWKLPAAKKLAGTATAFDYYQLLDNPAPIADRYWFVHARVGVEGSDRVFRWDQLDAAAKYPAEAAALQARFPEAVPTRTNLGDWTFTPSPAGTRVRYRICTDAGGNVPRWAGEIAARNTLPGNVADIVREVRRRAAPVSR
ncbi:MAG: hypothetical protein ACOZNI_24805 [Myxococcota bacterium]